MIAAKCRTRSPLTRNWSYLEHLKKGYKSLHMISMWNSLIWASCTDSSTPCEPGTTNDSCH